MISEKKIQDNWDRFLSIIEEQANLYPSENRWSKLLVFYKKYEQRIALMPASSRTHFHSAFPGGHIEHTLRVYDTAIKLSTLWQEMGASVDFTEEELIFTALNHDIGKFGTYYAETFIDQDSDWHAKRGEVYKHNPEVPFMKDYDRSLYLLQDLGVKLSEAEFLAIKLQSGLYEESNKSYFISYSPEFRLKSNLPYIIHQADAMSARIDSVQQVVAPKAKQDVPTPKRTQTGEVIPKPKNKFTKYLTD